MEKINIEHITKAKDKRGGFIVNVCRSKTRGRMVSARWKDIRFLDGAFEKWPGRWSEELRKELTIIVGSWIERNIKALEAGKKITVNAAPADPSMLTNHISGFV